MQITFTIPEVRGKGRPRFFRGHAVTDSATRNYETLITHLSSVAMKSAGFNHPIEDSVHVDMTAFFQIPKSYSKKKAQQCLNGVLRPGKPDADNIVKAVLDGMNKIVYLDDKQVYDFHIEKKYSDSEYGVRVTVRSANDKTD